jgi:MFS family permease
MAGTPPARLKNHQLRRARRLIIMEGTLGALTGQLTQGILLVKFARELGAGPGEIAVLLAVPQFISALQILSSWIINRLGDPKRIALLYQFLHRLVWMLLGLGAVFFLRPGARGLVWGLIAANGVAALAGQMAVVAWYTWVAELAPVRFWGRFLGRRQMIALLFATPVGIAAGLFADAWFKRHPHGDLSGVGWMVVLGAVLGFAALLLLARVPAVTLHRAEAPPPFRRILAAALQDASFRRLALTRCWITFFVQVAAPMWQLYALTFLGVPLWTMKSWEAIANFSTAGGNRLCGRLADYYGYRSVAILFCIGMGTIPVWWILASKATWILPLPFVTLAIPAYWIVLLSNTLGSFSWSGVNLCATNLALKLAERQHRAAYVALFQAAFGITGGLGALVGGRLVNLAGGGAGDASVALAFQMVFLLSALGRWAAMIGLASVREPGGTPAPRLARILLASLMRGRLQAPSPPRPALPTSEPAIAPGQPGGAA